MFITTADINALIKRAIEWARDHESGCLYGDSADGGKVNLIIDNRHYFEGHYYLTIVISSISIPSERQNEGLYRRLLRELDGTGKFGLRCHSTTENVELADRHRRHGYIEKKAREWSSFYQVIGNHLPKSVEHKLLGQCADIKDRLGASRGNRVGGLIKKPKQAHAT